MCDRMDVKQSTVLLSEEELKRQIVALHKINNLTGFLPIKIEELLPAIKEEIEEVFVHYECNFNIFAEDYACSGLTSVDCKALRDQLPMISGQDQACPCSVGETCQKIYRSHICVPLISGTEIFGVITLKSTVQKGLSRDMLEILLAIANQVAATLQRSQLLNRLAQEKNNLEEANKEITQLNSSLLSTIEELKRTQRQLIYSERLAAAGRLAANLTHEINNPTGIILSRLEWLLLDASEKELPEEVVKDLLVIKKHTERIAQTTRGLLSFSRRTKNETALVDLENLIKETVVWLERQFSRKDIVIVLNLSPLPLINGNKDQLEQVLVNLLTNAKDALPEGGQITITTRHHTEKNHVQIDIEDNGTGIPEDMMNSIFDPFFSTKEKELGTGLGLPISLTIMKEHGGFLRMESTPHEGSCFSMILPCVPENQEGDLNE
ncbi:Histidine kinase [Desulfitobacterium hafniense]|uniref:histidine kinase n=1 Tax=Desulfitobacterium hafniense TaxID=49338 RepID=A0A098AUQ2_DESHA|nr:GAF domain-containing sensor histidine kinase [Desulfitobacterium hafniense]CDX00234.1 Histidine kinase [Desulfitobacterium hafniense]